MPDAKQLRAAVGKYTRLCRKLEESRSGSAQRNAIRDISGAFIDRAIHEQIVTHLQQSLILDDEDDGIRLMLAYEYWRAAKVAEAAVEYHRIVQRGSMQGLVAARMLEEIERHAS